MVAAPVLDSVHALRYADAMDYDALRCVLYIYIRRCTGLTGARLIIPIYLPTYLPTYNYGTPTYPTCVCICVSLCDNRLLTRLL